MSMTGGDLQVWPHSDDSYWDLPASIRAIIGRQAKHWGSAPIRLDFSSQQRYGAFYYGTNPNKMSIVRIKKVGSTWRMV
jgi:hypothetical protein